MRHYQKSGGYGMTISVVGPSDVVVECLKNQFLLPGPTWQVVNGMRKQQGS